MPELEQEPEIESRRSQFCGELTINNLNKLLIRTVGSKNEKDCSFFK
jgi:hypothetical protein